MLAFICRRLLQSVAVMFAASLIVFTGVFLIGNPVDLLISPEASQADRALAMAQLGLDRPVTEQYFAFVWRAFHGDLGRSFVFGQPAIELILQRMPATLELAFTALALSLAIGIPLGLVAGLRPKSVLDEAVMTGSILGYSMPTFWLGMILIMVFAVWLGWLPSTGRGDIGTILGIQTSFATWSGIRHLILPAIALSLFKISLIVRLTRSGARDVLMLDFVRTARAKGLSETRVVFRHVLPSVVIPVMTVIGIEFGNLIAFSVVTETIFAWPGAGKLLIDSINRLDRPVVVACLMAAAALFVLINLVVDILAVLFDPRIKLGREAGT